MVCQMPSRKTTVIHLEGITIMKKNFWRLWGIPILLAILSLFGLIAALLGDGLWDLLGWIALSVPLILVIRNYYK